MITTQPKSRGNRRMQELAKEFEAERQQLEDALIKGLGRPATPLDRIAAESLSAAVCRGRKMRSYGKDDAEVRKEIARLMKNFVKPAPITEVA